MANPVNPLDQVRNLIRNEMYGAHYANLDLEKRDAAVQAALEAADKQMADYRTQIAGLQQQIAHLQSAQDAGTLHNATGTLAVTGEPDGSFPVNDAAQPTRVETNKDAAPLPDDHPAVVAGSAQQADGTVQKTTLQNVAPEAEKGDVVGTMHTGKELTVDENGNVVKAPGKVDANGNFQYVTDADGDYVVNPAYVEPKPVAAGAVGSDGTTATLPNSPNATTSAKPVQAGEAQSAGEQAQTSDDEAEAQKAEGANS